MLLFVEKHQSGKIIGAQIFLSQGYIYKTGEEVVMSNVQEQKDLRRLGFVRDQVPTRLSHPNTIQITSYKHLVQ